jgi:two-component system chemotaxis response regulator CheB
MTRSSVQDPADALVASMPTAALALVPTATACPAAELGTAVAALAAERIDTSSPSVAERTLALETDTTESDQNTRDGPRLGEPAPVSCPDCTGGMNRVHHRAGPLDSREHPGGTGDHPPDPGRASPR